MKSFLIQVFKLSAVFSAVLFSNQAPSYFVAMDSSALELDSHSAHEEITRQSYDFLKQYWSQQQNLDHSKYLDQELRTLSQITKGVYATDVPNGSFVIKLPQFWNFPKDIFEWHNNPIGQHLHSLRNKTADGMDLESAYDACMGVKKDIIYVLDKAFDFLAAGDPKKYIFLVGHGLHIIQDSFSPAHTIRQTFGNFNLIDICYYGQKIDKTDACFHAENDQRDQIWLTPNLPELITLTENIWLPISMMEQVKVVGNLDDFNLGSTPAVDKKAYLKHDARLAKIATYKYLKLTLEFLVKYPKDVLIDQNQIKEQKEQFLQSMNELLSGANAIGMLVEDFKKTMTDFNSILVSNNSENAEATIDFAKYEQILNKGVMNCSELK